MHELGNQRIGNDAKDVIVTKTADGGLAIALWNLVDPEQHGSTRRITLSFSHLSPDARVSVESVDEQHGNVLKQYEAIGKPLDPTPAQVEQLNRETALPAPEDIKLHGGKLELNLTPDALVLVKVQP